MRENEIDVGHVYRSLRTSRIRDEVYNHVCNTSEELSAREIAIALGYPERNVLGALIGDGTRYKKEDSLEGMCLVVCLECNIHGYTMILVSVTEKNREIFRKNKLKDYAHYTKEDSIKVRTKNDEDGMACKG